MFTMPEGLAEIVGSFTEAENVYLEQIGTQGFAFVRELERKHKLAEGAIQQIVRHNDDADGDICFEGIHFVIRVKADSPFEDEIEWTSEHSEAFRA